MASTSDLIVITGASGKQGQHLVKHLYGKLPLRLVVHSPTSRDSLKSQYPEAEVVQADMSILQDCTRILDGAGTVYAMGPPFHVHEKEIGLNMIDAAVAASARSGSQFRHYVFSSVLNTQLRKMANHDDKRYVEEYLIESGLDFTILQPGDFVEQQFHIQQWMATESPNFTCMVNPNITSSVVCLEDLGEASAKVILDREKHYGATYPLVSRGPVVYQTLIDEVAQAMCKPIGLDWLSVEKKIEMAMIYTYGGVDKTPARARDKAERFVLFYSCRGLRGNPTVLEWLLGRKATSIQEYVQKQMA